MEKYIINKEDSSSRIDSYLIDILDMSRSKIQKMLKDGHIKVNNNVIKNSYLLKENDEVTIDEFPKEEMHVNPEKMDLDIVYEDDDIIVINKSNGIVVHPAAGNYHGTLVNGLMHYSKNLSTINGDFRPGIVHRIDAYTTGLLVVAKNDKAHEILARELEEHKIHRKYWAIVWGVIPNDTGTIDAPIGRDLNSRKKMTVTSINSKEAVTHFRVLERFNKVTLIELSLETGRTHQIRVHMNYIGYPIVNDPVYSNRKLIDDTGQCLHAKELGLTHPRTNQYMEFSSELPECFLNILESFKNS